MDALVLTYHAVEAGKGPLFVGPELFAAHLDCIVESGARVTTVSELAAELRSGSLEDRTVAITFDDGLASVARVAAPLLAARDLVATVFCVAGHLGATSDWESAPPGAPELEVAGATELVELTSQGIEIGCHGMTHAPLCLDDASFLQREIVDAKHVLEDATGTKVTSFAYPYGAAPTPGARALLEATYEAACTTVLGTVRGDADVHALPRVDAHYVRRPRLLRAALAGSLGPYLHARRLGAGARRAIRHDYAETASPS